MPTQQDPVIADVALFTSEPRFFAAIFVGVVLALALHIVMTHGAVLAGLIKLGDLDLSDEADEDSDGGEAGREPWTQPVKRAQAGIGTALIVAGSIALFAASWLGASLTMTTGTMTGVSVGLAIWALFYLMTVAAELRTVSAVGGGLIRSAGSVLSGTSSAIGSIVGRTERQAAIKTAEDVAAAVRDEFLGDSRINALRTELVDTLRGVREGEVASEFGNQVRSSLHDVELTVETQAEGAAPITATLHAEGSGKKKAKAAASAIKNGASTATAIAQEELQSNKRASDSAIDTVLRWIGTSSDAAPEQREALVNELAATGRDELDPDAIRDEVDLAFDEPKQGIDKLRERLNSFDRGTLRALLLRSDRVDEGRADKILATVDTVVGKIRERLDRTGEGSERSHDLTPHSRHVHRTLLDADQVQGRRAANEDSGESDRRVASALSDFFDDPLATVAALKARAESMTDDEIQRVAASIPGVDEARARSLATSIATHRDRALERASSMEQEVVQRMKSSKEQTTRRAEEVRQVAVHAAGWALGLALSGAAAAAAGGWVATL